ncbi:autoinducer binding domain-containing protein [Alphaproteobacteria bacterium]|nr:autoinducer binding domain-containing protein [Alphaproteobacteria bacterium]
MNERRLKPLKANTIPDVMNRFSKTLGKVGARYFSIVGVQKNGEVKHPINFYSSVPKDWGKYYHKKGFQKKDPMWLALSESSQSMYLWDASDPKVQFMKQSKDFGINYRLGIFIRTPKWHYAVIFSFKDNCEEIINSATHLHLLRTVCWLLVSQIKPNASELASPPPLTERELECLRWASEGKKVGF